MKDAESLNEKKHHQPLVEPLYLPEDIHGALKLSRTIPCGQKFTVLPELTATLFDAVTFSPRLLRQADCSTKRNHEEPWSLRGPRPKDHADHSRPVSMGQVETLISESTYGGKRHEPTSQMDTTLASAINRTLQRGGKIIVPAFSIGQTQDFVYCLHNLRESGKIPGVRIFIDSPLAINATAIYQNHPECFSDNLQRHILQLHDPLGLSRLEHVHTAEESKRLNVMSEPCIIIAASGMGEAGRILHHLANAVENSRNTILILGYQAEHTLGKKPVDGREEVKIFGEVYKRRAEVVVLNSFSAHADGTEVVESISRFAQRLQRIFLAHGDFERARALKTDLMKQNLNDVEILSRGEAFSI